MPRQDLDATSIKDIFFNEIKRFSLLPHFSHKKMNNQTSQSIVKLCVQFCVCVSKNLSSFVSSYWRFMKTKFFSMVTSSDEENIEEHGAKKNCTNAENNNFRT